MAQNNSRPVPSRQDDMPRKPPQAATLNYPEIAIEYGIEKPMWLSLLNLYPGAQDNSIVMVYEYCKSRNLDPLKKPVHIVPMYIEDKASGKKGMRDVIMPGIQEMRTTAARTQEYAGIDPVVLGKLIEVPVTNAESAPANVKTISVPESATVTVYRLVKGKRYAFTHTEYFLEAVARENSGLINSMWRKRPIGQMSKCAEAGGLRKAFPEELGGEYAAEEMEGREEFVPQGLPDEPDHGASGIPAPETADARDAGLEQATTPVPTDEAAKITEAAKPVDKAVEKPAKPKAKPAEAAAPALTPEETAEVKQADEAAAQALAGDFKIELPEGASKLLRAQMEARGVTEAQLLAKVGADITTRNINVALSAIKGWE